MCSLSTILVNRLVLNLRERAAKQLPTTVETTGRFQAALPASRQLPSMTSVRNPSSVRQNRPTTTATATRETVASLPAGESPSQQPRNVDEIGYGTRRRSQTTLSVGRQQPATSASVRGLSSARQKSYKRPGCYYNGPHTFVTETVCGACTYSGGELVVVGGITGDMRGEIL